MIGARNLVHVVNGGLKCFIAGNWVTAMNLYHYCSTDAFFNIVTSKSVWLSSLTASNDSEEGKWLARVVRRICLANDLDPIHADLVEDHVKRLQEKVGCLGFCLSEDGDMLSQWRGYANDAAGISIGFPIEGFDQMFRESAGRSTVSLRKVAYTQDEQDALVASVVKEALQHATDAFQGPTLLGFDPEKHASYDDALAAHKQSKSEFTEKLLGLYGALYRVKNPAFSEEREWRLTTDHFSDWNSDPVSFRVRGEQIVPYRPVAFPQSYGTAMIKEVILGPKNPTPVAVVSQFLLANRIRCTVRTSEATYR